MRTEAIPINVYTMDQTTGKTQFGGLNGGCFRDVYHLLTTASRVVSAATKPRKLGRAMPPMYRLTRGWETWIREKDEKLFHHVVVVNTHRMSIITTIVIERIQLMIMSRNDAWMALIKRNESRPMQSVCFPYQLFGRRRLKQAGDRFDAYYLIIRFARYVTNEVKDDRLFRLHLQNSPTDRTKRMRK